MEKEIQRERIQESDLYICSECKQEIERSVNICPHCTELLDQKFTRVETLLSRFGIVGSVIGLGIYATGILTQTRILCLSGLLLVFLMVTINIVYWRQRGDRIIAWDWVVSAGL